MTSPTMSLYRLWLAFGPRPSGIRQNRLLEVLRPMQNEHLLEIGPGGGYYSLPVAGKLREGGRLTLVDIDQGMLDFTLKRLRSKGLDGVARAVCSDASSLPFEDDSLDGAFLVAVLGEIGDRRAALRELFRVIRNGGRLIVGEVLFDPHALRPNQLQHEVEEAGFEFEALGGTRWSYLARFRRP